MIVADRDSQSRRPKRSPSAMPKRITWKGRFIARAIYGVIRGLEFSIRLRVERPSRGLERAIAGPCIFALWHNQLALAIPVFERITSARSRGRRMAAIVSASGDGALVARVLELFGVDPVRGSTSRRGPQALLELVTRAEKGMDLAITPDGPRGPCYRVQEGVIAVAQITGLPVIGACIDARPHFRLKSWDRFRIPVPFGACRLSLTDPVCVPRELSDAQREEYRQLLETQMRALTQD